MALENFSPSAAYNEFEEQNGEDTYIKLNLMYIAMELNEIYTEESNKNGEFDDLCEDILEMYLSDQFDGYKIEDIADGIMFIMSDSNYSVKLYTLTYRQHKDTVCEELLAYLNKQRKAFAEKIKD